MLQQGQKRWSTMSLEQLKEACNLHFFVTLVRAAALSYLHIEYWDALFSFNRLISVSICLKLTSLKLKIPSVLHLVLNARVFSVFKSSFYQGWFFDIFCNRIKIRILGNVKILYKITRKSFKNLSCSFFSFHNSTFIT